MKSLEMQNLKCNCCILGAPVIYIHSRDLALKIGETAVIFCLTNGSPRPTVTWYKKGFSSAVSTGENLTIVATINGLLTYVCISKNIAGENGAEITIEVSGNFFFFTLNNKNIHTFSLQTFIVLFIYLLFHMSSFMNSFGIKKES